jgi:DNA excision repair protein ERCC-2
VKSALQISVRNLVDFTLRSGDLETSFALSANPVEAIYAHQRIQKSRGENYTREVSVSHRVETEQFLLDIVGRIDGLYLHPDRVIVDEIKTTTRDLDAVAREDNPLHWGQAQCYASIYAFQNNLNEIEVQLTYYHLETGDIREIRRSFSREELDGFFQSLVDRYLAWAAAVAAWSRERDESISALEFPFASFRSGQRAMAAAVYTAVRNREQILIQAPTGIGKTMAALFPALKTLPPGFASKIFYLTARTTGKNTAENALAMLREHGLKAKSVTITAREKICFRPDAACRGEECEYARGYYDRIREALADAYRQEAFTRDRIEEIAEEHRVCPFEFSLDISLWADCIVCDYNYVYDPRVYLRRFFLEKTGDYVFLVDEAHNLVDRAREMFSAELPRQPFRELRKKVKDTLPEIYRILGRINTRMSGMCRQYRETNPCAEKERPEKLLPLLRKFLTAAERWLVMNRPSPFREELLDLYFPVHGFLRVADQYDSSYATCYSIRGDDLTVRLFCIDPAGQLRAARERGIASVFFSATLTPADYFRRMFGCSDSAADLILPSPFPPENLLLVIAGGISTLYTDRTGTRDRIARMILSLIQQKQGNHLIFFPSYEYLRLVLDRCVQDCPEMDIIVQTPGMTEAERERFIARFSHDNTETLAGFAVMGGVFGEGIDLVGDRLTGAVIVGVGLPAICLERELIRDYFAQKDEAGFEFAYLYPGFTRVLQAAGRVIRSGEDRGVVLLIDKRFASERYRILFPREWNALFVRDEAHLSRIVREFWRE